MMYSFHDRVLRRFIATQWIRYPRRKRLLSGHVASAQNTFAGEHFAHPVYIPPKEVTLDTAFHDV